VEVHREILTADCCCCSVLFLCGVELVDPGNSWSLYDPEDAAIHADRGLSARFLAQLGLDMGAGLLERNCLYYDGYSDGDDYDSGFDLVSAVCCLRDYGDA